jgi:hypothetical protein
MIFRKNPKFILKFRDRALIIIFIIFLGTVAVKAFDKKIGNLSISEKAGQCPSDMVLITAGEKNFCLDKYEASASHNCPYADPLNQSDTRINLNDSKCLTLSQAGFFTLAVYFSGSGGPGLR